MAAGDLLYDSGRIDGTAQGLTLPKGVITHKGVPYYLVVRAWDDIERENVPEHPGYAEADREFTYASGATAGVTAMAGADLYASSGYADFGAIISFTRASGAPDEFELERDGEVVKKVDAADAILTSTTFRIKERENIRPNHEHSYVVRAIVNGVSSADSATLLYTPTTNGIWLIDPVDESRIHLLDVDAGSWDMWEVSEIKHALGAARPTKVTQTLGGYVGDLTGRLVAHPKATYAELMDNLHDLKQRPSRTMRLVVSDLNIPVIVSNLVDRPTPNPEIERVVSFHFEQDGELPWNAEG